MAQYRKIPPISEAVQFLGIVDGVPVFNEMPPPAWIEEGFAKVPLDSPIPPSSRLHGAFYITSASYGTPTLGFVGQFGVHSLSVGSWLVRDHMGWLTEVYDKAFHTTYVPVTKPENVQS